MESSPQTQAGLSIKAARIMIVEDEGIIAGHIASRLMKTGYEIAGIAESSEQALAMIPELIPELVLMDIHIKGSMDGIETAEKLRERFDIPVVYLTAHTDQQTLARAKTTGAFGFLTKPVHHTSLSIAVEMAIHKHRSDREARHQRAWMATVLDTMADAMVVIDRERKVQFLNSPAATLTGWTNEDARDLDLAAVLPLTNAVSRLRADQVLSLPAVPHPPVDIPRDLLASARDGKWFPIEGEVATSVDDGKVVGAVITFRDATARQTREREIRQQHKMQAVGRLAAGIAHDFNNLLFVMLGYTEEMLTKSPRQDYDLVALNEIKRAGEKAAGITQQLLSFSRNEPLAKKNINLNELIGAEEGLFRRLCGPSHTWNFKLEPDLGTVQSDRGQLTQVLMNLVANARDSMPDGGRVTIETMNVDLPLPGSATNEREGFVGVSVRDNGSGMTSDTAEHLFEPFFTTKERGSGTGLGLSIAHSIITGDGGTIHVDSEPGRGSTFTIYLPRVEAVGAVPDSEMPTRRRTPEPSTVLLVEDQDGVRNLVRGYLLSAGYKVLEAENGEDAIRIANGYAGAIDLLVTDVLMPKAGGLEVAQALGPQRPEMKIVFISGYAQELLNGLESMPTDAQFLPKPFVRTELLKVVSDLLAGRETLTMRMA